MGGIQLSDLDQVGEVLQVICQDVEKVRGKKRIFYQMNLLIILIQDGQNCEEFSIVPEQMTSRFFRGSIVLQKPLSYQKKNKYQLKLIASVSVWMKNHRYFNFKFIPIGWGKYGLSSFDC